MWPLLLARALDDRLATLDVLVDGDGHVHAALAAAQAAAQAPEGGGLTRFEEVDALGELRPRRHDPGPEAWVEDAVFGHGARAHDAPANASLAQVPRRGPLPELPTNFSALPSVPTLGNWSNWSDLALPQPRIGQPRPERRAGPTHDAASLPTHDAAPRYAAGPLPDAGAPLPKPATQHTEVPKSAKQGPELPKPAQGPALPEELQDTRTVEARLALAEERAAQAEARADELSKALDQAASVFAQPSSDFPGQAWAAARARQADPNRTVPFAPHRATSVEPGVDTETRLALLAQSESASADAPRVRALAKRAGVELTLNHTYTERDPVMAGIQHSFEHPSFPEPEKELDAMELLRKLFCGSMMAAGIWCLPCRAVHAVAGVREKVLASAEVLAVAKDGCGVLDIAALSGGLLQFALLQSMTGLGEMWVVLAFALAGGVNACLHQMYATPWRAGALPVLRTSSCVAAVSATLVLLLSLGSPRPRAWEPGAPSLQATVVPALTGVAQLCTLCGLTGVNSMLSRLSAFGADQQQVCASQAQQMAASLVGVALGLAAAAAHRDARFWGIAVALDAGLVTALWTLVGKVWRVPAGLSCANMLKTAPSSALVLVGLLVNLLWAVLLAAQVAPWTLPSTQAGPLSFLFAASFAGLSAHRRPGMLTSLLAIVGAVVQALCQNARLPALALLGNAVALGASGALAASAAASAIAFSGPLPLAASLTVLGALRGLQAVVALLPFPVAPDWHLTVLLATGIAVGGTTLLELERRLPQGERPATHKVPLFQGKI